MSAAAVMRTTTSAPLWERSGLVVERKDETETAMNDAAAGDGASQFTGTTYPSNCLQFLSQLKPGPDIYPTTGPTLVQQAAHPLKVLVIGAGLGGLATATALARRGHQVTVFEQASVLAEVGAGIQVPPNVAKLLSRWGVLDELADQAVQPSGISFRRWEDGTAVGFTDLSADFSATHGSPYYVVHRAHLHSALVKTAVKSGATIRLKSKVTRCNSDAPSITLADGMEFCGDLIIAADGIKSIGRESVPAGSNSTPKPTGLAAYRAIVDVEKMRQLPELSWLLAKPNLNVWIGEDRHVMTYTIAAGKSFNMVLSHKDTSDPAEWGSLSQEETIQNMRAEFASWDPQLCKVIDLVEHAIKWPLLGGSSLDSWISPSNRLVVLGDAAHAMVPYMSQGAAMAMEDGASLAIALNDARNPSELKLVLGAWEKERKQRSCKMQEASMVNAMIWHYPDGPEQQARDEAMRPEVEGRHFFSSPNQWSDPLTQIWAYSHDAEATMSRTLEALGIGR